MPLRTYNGTFLIFSDYQRPAVRLAALMGIGSIFVWTHDSIGLGEDGPTHQPVEQLASLRAIPGLDVTRPADANEVAVVWREIIKRSDRPAGIALTRQGVPTFARGAGKPVLMSSAQSKAQPKAPMYWPRQSAKASSLIRMSSSSAPDPRCPWPLKLVRVSRLRESQLVWSPHPAWSGSRTRTPPTESPSSLRSQGSSSGGSCAPADLVPVRR